MPNPASTSSTPLLSARHKRAIVFSLLLAAALYLLVAFNVGYTRILTAIARVDIRIWLVLLAGSLTNYLVRFVRWQFFLQRFGHRLPHFLHFSYYLAGFALTTTPGKAGEVIRSVLLRPHAVPYTQSIACFFTERLLDVAALTILATFTVLAFDGYRGFILSAVLLILLALALLRCARCHAWLRWWQRRVPLQRLRQMFWHLLNLLARARNLFEFRTLLIGLLLGVLAWSAQGYTFMILLQHLDSHLPFFIAMGIYALSLLIGAASFLPGGVGSTELAMYLLLRANAVDESTALIIPLVSRLTTLWFAVSLGLLATTYLSVRRQKI